MSCHGVPRHSGNTFCLQCTWLLTKAREKQCRKNMCGNMLLVLPGPGILLQDKDTRSSSTGVGSHVLRKFLGLFLLLLGGTSGETAVHVVARLSSHVFTVATPSHGRCGHRIACQHPMPGRPGCGTAQPVTNKLPSMWVILKHWPKLETKQPCRLSNVLHVFSIHHSLTRAA